MNYEHFTGKYKAKDIGNDTTFGIYKVDGDFETPITEIPVDLVVGCEDWIPMIKEEALKLANQIMEPIKVITDDFKFKGNGSLLDRHFMESLNPNK